MEHTLIVKCADWTPRPITGVERFSLRDGVLKVFRDYFLRSYEEPAMSIGSVVSLQCVPEQ